jgi:hypothetical protein
MVFESSQCWFLNPAALVFESWFLNLVLAWFLNPGF